MMKCILAVSLCVLVWMYYSINTVPVYADSSVHITAPHQKYIIVMASMSDILETDEYKKAADNYQRLYALYKQKLQNQKKAVFGVVETKADLTYEEIKNLAKGLPVLDKSKGGIYRYAPGNAFIEPLLYKQLALLVEEKIAEGWMPQGGVSVSASLHASQAMIKK